jgi:hypothetical protein
MEIDKFLYLAETGLMVKKSGRELKLENHFSNNNNYNGNFHMKR